MVLRYVKYNNKQEVKFVEQCTRNEFKTWHDCYKLCDMLRNFYEIYVITQIMWIMWIIELWKQVFKN